MAKATTIRTYGATIRERCSLRKLNSCAPNGAQAFLLPANGETERGVKTIDKLGVLFNFTKKLKFFVTNLPIVKAHEHWAERVTREVRRLK